ncbi:MAG: DUF3098 domain-containing protein [Balneolaceae bacterium]|nr:DUF3098 domain-containing protein [Balneolaceae bacterium]
MSKDMLFGSWNYKVLAAGLLLIVVGFSAMYIENEVNGFISLFVSPVVIMAGYISIIVAIMKRKNGESDVSGQPSS